MYDTHRYFPCYTGDVTHISHSCIYISYMTHIDIFPVTRETLHTFLIHVYIYHVWHTSLIHVVCEWVTNSCTWMSHELWSTFDTLIYHVWHTSLVHVRETHTRKMWMHPWMCVMSPCYTLEKWDCHELSRMCVKHCHELSRMCVMSPCYTLEKWDCHELSRMCVKHCHELSRMCVMSPCYTLEERRHVTWVTNMMSFTEWVTNSYT